MHQEITRNHQETTNHQEIYQETTRTPPGPPAPLLFLGLSGGFRVFSSHRDQNASLRCRRNSAVQMLLHVVATAKALPRLVRWDSAIFSNSSPPCRLGFERSASKKTVLRLGFPKAATHQCKTCTARHVEHRTFRVRLLVACTNHYIDIGLAYSTRTP